MAIEKKRSILYEVIIVKSWWVILFFLICYFIYDQGIKRKYQEKESLQKKLVTLHLEKEEALKKQEELRLQIKSQTDPAWIELVLMRRLGLVPEGQTKIIFNKSTSENNP